MEINNSKHAVGTPIPPSSILEEESGFDFIEEGRQAHIAKLVNEGGRLDYEDAVSLFRLKDLLALGQLANKRREAINQDNCYYNRNLHLNYSNVCEADCIFCSFARLRMGMPQAYALTVEQCLSWVRERYQEGMTEVHIVGGLNPDLPFDYYLKLLDSLRREFPALHLKAFTAVEIHYFSQKFGLSYREILSSFKDAGLGSLPGGGAEVFAPRVRKKICADKVDAQGWLEVHRTAHNLGLKTNCTMLYGTIETIEERVSHLLMLRDLQDETGGFQSFVPLAYHPENNRLSRLGGTSILDDLRTIAASRLVLDNIPHIKAYWVMLGIKTAQLALSFGADDLDGTVTEEKIYHMAGAVTPDSLSVEELTSLIKEAGRKPVERSSLYDIVQRGALDA